MSAMRRFVLRIRNMLRPAKPESELAREIAAHLALIEDEFLRRGLTPAQARIAAKRAFDGVDRAKEMHRDARSLAWLEHAWRDLRYASATLRKNRGFATAAIATLALGIGASTAMFSVAYGVALRPLPYPNPQRLVRIYEANPANGQLKQDVAEGTFLAWRAGAASIEGAALYAPVNTRFTTAPDRPAVTTRSVSPAFFDVLGIRPMIGPGFQTEEAYGARADDAVLSYGAWQRLFGGRPDIIGETIEYAGVRGTTDPYRIVGVMPEDFAFAEPVDAWHAAIIRQPIAPRDRGWRYDRVVARLRSGATTDRARAELEVVAGRLAREFPATDDGWTATVEPLHDSIIGPFRSASWLLLASVVVVLLVTCLNVGGLLVARSVARQRETAVRLALGAGRGRLITLRLAEASLLGALGGGIGVLLAWWGVATLKAVAPPGIPRLDAVALDFPTLAAAALSMLVAIVGFTLAPIGRARRLPLVDDLRGGPSIGDPRSRQSFRTAVTIAQCAGATTLVVLAVLLTRSFVRLTSVDLGWDATGVLSMNVYPPMRAEVRTWNPYVEWSDRLIAQLEATPGIEGAAVTTQVPLSPQSFPATLARGRGKAGGDDARWPGVLHNVTDGYFRLMGIRLVSGRTFGAIDRATDAQPTGTARVGTVVVSEQTARILWPDRLALGEALWLPDFASQSGSGTWSEVVGVVEDIQFHAVGEAAALHVFVPWTRSPTGRPRLLVKGVDGAAPIPALVRTIAQRVEPGTQMDQIVSLDALVSRATAQPRFTSAVVAAFGLLALVLAAVGIYGTLSYLVRARTREIGIRLALGAPRQAIVSRIVGRGLIPVIAGGLVGLALAAALGRMFSALLFEVEPIDAGARTGGALILLLVALAAALGPARRASRIDPVSTLRTD